jgi:hypothetical protein
MRGPVGGWLDEGFFLTAVLRSALALDDPVCFGILAVGREW